MIVTEVVDGGEAQDSERSITGKHEETAMIEETVLDKEQSVKTPVEEKPILDLPVQQLVIEITETGRTAGRKFRARGKQVLIGWRNLPKERRRFFELVGLSVGVSVVMTVLTTIVVRLLRFRVFKRGRNKA